MNGNAEKFVEGLLTKEAYEKPSDTVKLELLQLELPEWFDENKYNKGRQFFWSNRLGLTISIALGIIPVLAIPSVLRVTIGTYRATTVYTAYRRYVSTVLHMFTWLENDLKPGSASWKSLLEVRKRHIRASLAGKLKGFGKVSQRDLALSHFGFISFAMMRPDVFGVKQLGAGDWEAYNHFWKVIGYMIGIQDKYNICRETFGETRKVCQILLKRVFTPAMEVVPEYYEHMIQTVLDGVQTVVPVFNADTMMFLCKYVLSIPGYVCTELERIDFQEHLNEQLGEVTDNIRLNPPSCLIFKTSEEMVSHHPRVLYLEDYDTLETVPAYQELPTLSKIRLHIIFIIFSLYSTSFGRIFFNFLFTICLAIVKYFPLLAFFRFGFKKSLVNPFTEDPVNYTHPKTNAEFYNKMKRSRNCN